MPPNPWIRPGRTLRPGATATSPPSRPGSQLVTTPILRAAFYLTVLYIFLLASRLPEFTGGHLRPMAVLAVALLGAVLLSGRMLAVLETRIGWLMMIFTGWLAFVTLFSRWRGGSTQVVLNFLKVLFALLIIAAFAQSIRDSLRIAYTVGFAMGTAALMSRMVGTELSGRLSLDSQRGTLGDPNFFCLYILVGMPLLWLKARHSAWHGKILPVGFSLLILWSALRTASRSGLIAFLAGMLFLFWHAAPKQKVKFLVVGAGLGAILLLTAPQQTLQRLTTWFEEDEIQNTVPEEDRLKMSEAVESVSLRRHLLWQSIRITLKNPLFGVGPGRFVEVEAEMASQEGRRGAWRHTHNMYTEISSETGIPGLVLFLALIVSVYRSLTRIRKLAAADGAPQHQLVPNAALYLQAAVVIVLVEGLFLNLAFASLLYLLAGLTLGLEAAVKREWAGLPRPMAGTTLAAGKAVRE